MSFPVLPRVTPSSSSVGVAAEIPTNALQKQNPSNEQKVEHEAEASIRRSQARRRSRLNELEQKLEEEARLVELELLQSEMDLDEARKEFEELLRSKITAVSS